MARGTPTSTTNVQLSDADIQIGAVEIKDSSGSARAAVASGADNLANGNQLITAAVLYTYDGTTYDRARTDSVADFSTPTATMAVAGYPLLYDPDQAVWFRQKGTQANGLDVDVTRIGSGANVIGKVRLVTATGDEVTNDTLDTVAVSQATASSLNCTEASASAIKTAVELIDNAVSGAGFNITQLNGAAVPIGAGLESTALRVTVATDSTGVLSIDDNGASLTIDNAALSVVGTGLEATALRVTIASDSTGVLSVDDNGGALTVDGTVTAAQTTPTSLKVQIFGDDTTSAINTDATGDLQVDVLTMPSVTVDSEFPVAAAITDNFANPTTTSVMAMGMVWDSVTWDRMVGDATNGVLVNLGTNNDVTVTSGTLTAVTSITNAVAVTDNAGSLTVDNSTLSVVGTGLEATALRVTIATDSTGVLSVDDNGGAITVDWAGTAPPIGAGLEATALRVTVATDSTGVLSIDDNSGSLTIDNAALSVVGTGLEATALRVTIATDSTGVLSVDDNAGSLTVDNAALSVVGTGLEATALRVTIASDSTGVLSVDDNGSTISIDDGAGNISIDWAGTVPPIGAGLEATALRVTLATDSTGLVSIDDNGGSITVDGTFYQATQPVSIAAAVAVTDAISGGWDNTASDGASVSGDVAHDGVDAGEPVKLGAKGVSSLDDATMVAANDRTNLYADLDGVLITKKHCPGADIIMERVSNTDGAATAFTNFGATVSTYNYITSLVVHNAHASTNGYVDIRDGAAGTVLATLPLPANGGTAITFPVPLRSTANTAFAFDVSAAITTVYISAIGFKSKA